MELTNAFNGRFVYKDDESLFSILSHIQVTHNEFVVASQEGRSIHIDYYIGNCLSQGHSGMGNAIFPLLLGIVYEPYCSGFAKHS